MKARSDSVGARVRVSVSTAAGDREFGWLLPEQSPSDVGDAVLAATLLPAMATGEDLVLDDPVSSRLLHSVGTIQDVLTQWSRERNLLDGIPRMFGRVAVEAPTREGTSSPPSGRGTAAFFSGGVDSFYTAVRNRDELAALVFVGGIDLRLDDPDRERVMGGVRSAAQELGVPLVEVATDLRMFTDPFVPWVSAHGAGLASVALLLAPWFDRVLVPATQTYGSLTPLGSHPLLDPLWSTDDVEIVHDGCEANRLEKIEAIAASDTAARWLRVCPQHPGGANCGECEKCLRTTVGIRIAGLSERFASLLPLRDADLHRVARVAIPGRGLTWREFLGAAERAGTDPRLRRALRAAFRRRRRRDRHDRRRLGLPPR